MTVLDEKSHYRHQRQHVNNVSNNLAAHLSRPIGLFLSVTLLCFQISASALVSTMLS